MALPPDQELATTFISALFYGLYLSTVYAGLSVRTKVGTMVVVLNEGAPKPPPSGTTLSINALPWMSVVTCTNANVSTLLADAVLIYRCWIIYAKSRRVIVFPIILWAGGLVLTALQAYWKIVQSASILKAWQPVNMSVGPGTISMPFWALTIILNGYSTFMIVRRIYLVAKESKGLGGQSSRQLEFAMRILIESGFLYLAAAIAHFVSWWTPNAYAIVIISDINLPVTGIAFNLILIRAAQHRVEEMTKAADTRPMSDIQLLALETKSPVGQFGINTQVFAFQNPDDDSNPVIDITGNAPNSNTTSIV